MVFTNIYLHVSRITGNKNMKHDPLIKKKTQKHPNLISYQEINPSPPVHMVYGVYISQLIRYSRACGSYQAILDRDLRLTRKLLKQGFILVNFYGRHRDLVDRYGISCRCHKWPRICSIRCKNLPGPYLIHDISPGL